jgi:hypothetical protein
MQDKVLAMEVIDSVDNLFTGNTYKSNTGFKAYTALNSSRDTVFRDRKSVLCFSWYEDAFYKSQHHVLSKTKTICGFFDLYNDLMDIAETYVSDFKVVIADYNTSIYENISIRLGSIEHDICNNNINYSNDSIRDWFIIMDILSGADVKTLIQKYCDLPENNIFFNGEFRWLERIIRACKEGIEFINYSRFRQDRNLEVLSLKCFYNEIDKIIYREFQKL